MSDGFARRKAQSKEDIRKAAWELFSQFGIDKVSMVDIARKAGVSQATIYNNFDSKAALAREFITTIIDQLVDRVQALLTPDKPYWEKMVDLIQFISGTINQGSSDEVSSLVFNSSLDLLNDPEIRKVRQSAEDKMTGILLGLVNEGKQQGHIHMDLSDEALRIYFNAFMDMFADPQLRQHYFRDPKIIQDLNTLMMHGLSVQKP